MTKTILISGPVDTHSGYGEHARDITRSILNEQPGADIQIFSTNWGTTPFGALDSNDPSDKQILDNIRTTPLTERPDLFIQISVPNEFKPIGKFNIGVTAGIETTLASAKWIEGANRMDQLIVPSEFAKKTLETSSWQKLDSKTDKPIGIINLTTPIVVLFEGIDTSVFYKTDKTDTIDKTLKDIQEDFIFLSVGHWLNGDLGHDRKNIGMMIKTFLETFANYDKPPALLLKTGIGSYSKINEYAIRDKINRLIQDTKSELDINKLPTIYFLHGNLTKQEMNELYNHSKIKTMLSFTKGEGYGRPLAEFAITGKPIIVSNWSGHLDFLLKKPNMFLNGHVEPVHPSAAWKDVLLKEANWFRVDYNKAKIKMRDMFKHYENNSRFGQSQSKFMLNNLTINHMSEELGELIESALNSIPEQKTVNIPKLDKTLPKLK